MRFYKVAGRVKKFDRELVEKGEKVSLRRFSGECGLQERLKHLTEEYNAKSESTYVVVTDLSNNEVSVCLLAQSNDVPDEICFSYLREMGISFCKPNVRELTFSEYRDQLRKADRYDIIDDDDLVLARFGLSELARSLRSVNFEERVIDPRSNKEIDRLCRTLLTSKDLMQEIFRIRAMKGSIGVKGHPVHYLLCVDDGRTLEQTSGALLEALIKSGRFNSRRICEVSLAENPRPSLSSLRTLYEMNDGGVVVFKVDQELDLQSDRADERLDVVDKICRCMQDHRNSVLTVVLLSLACETVRNYLFERLGALCFVEIAERAADVPRAKRMFAQFAKEGCLEADDNLFAKLEKGETYLTAELRVLYEEWHSTKLKTEIYPQYAEFRTVAADAAKKDTRGSAHDELMSLVGLSEAKRVINGAIDYRRIQKYLLSKNVVRERPAYHMLFTGNPGSAKTTVARLFGRIMRENELISSGHIVEVGRADLVGRYVGHTAPLVKKCFDRAEGGVLFIDEAYSLVDDRDGCFGDEAINAIVQEMENRRDSVVVIFAGYPDKMKLFLQKNPGLSSRISFHVDFPDYSGSELCDIAALIAGEKGMRLSEGAMHKLLEVFELGRTESDFGNGRYARSVIEKAMMAQASRLVRGDLSELSKSDYCTITADDIILPEIPRLPQRHIGFCA